MSRINLRRWVFLPLLGVALAAAPSFSNAAPAWIERVKDRVSLAPVVGQEYRFDDAGGLRSTGLLTVGALHYAVATPLSAFAFYGLSNRASGQNSQVAGAGLQYTDLVGITALGGCDADRGFAGMRRRDAWFLALGLAFHGLELDLSDLSLGENP